MGVYLKNNYNKFFPKYEKEELLNEINRYKRNEITKLKKLDNHFFKEVRYKAKYIATNGINKIDDITSPYDMISDDSYIQDLIDNVLYAEKNEKFFEGIDEVLRIERYMRFHAGIVSNFNPKHVNFINEYAKEYFEDYFKRFNVHDPSCGWGCRMMVNLIKNNNYFGTDPNTRLFEKLEEAKELITSHNKRIVADLKCQGSEIFIPEWENKMDYSFTSPPYFDLEIYCDEDTQSVNKNYNTDDKYQYWLDTYVKGTVDNIHKYVINGGFAGINIKNIKKYNLYDDWFNTFKEHGGFEFVEELELDWESTKNINKNGKEVYKEKVMIFKVIK